MWVRLAQRSKQCGYARYGGVSVHLVQIKPKVLHVDFLIEVSFYYRMRVGNAILVTAKPGPSQARNA